MTKTVYATIPATSSATYRDVDYRLRGSLADGDNRVLVGHANGPDIGWYNLTRFEGGRLTAKTLRNLFTPA